MCAFALSPPPPFLYHTKTYAIAQANNARDIKTDIKAGATTLASLIGLTHSYRLYVGLIAGAYLAVAAVAWHLNWGVLATLLVAPLAVGLVRAFAAGKLKNLDEETAKFHLPFGVLLVLGVLFTDRGLGEAVGALWTK